MNNRKGLESNIKQLGLELKTSKSVAEHFQGTLIKQLRNLDSEFNDGSKHASETSEIEAEFVIYQTGVIINTINRFKESSHI